MVFFWTGVGNAAKVATIGSGLKAAFDSYQALGSPDTFLQKAGKKLDKVKSRLQELTPQQREEIEQNVVPGDGPHKSIDDLEVQLQECVPLTATFSFQVDLWRRSLDFETCTVDYSNGMTTQALWIVILRSHNFGIASWPFRMMSRTCSMIPW